MPVVIFQGGLDGNVPPGHARWLAQHIPGAELRFDPDDGHVPWSFRTETKSSPWRADCSSRVLDPARSTSAKCEGSCER